jgi:hypothetical protein
VSDEEYELGFRDGEYRASERYRRRLEIASLEYASLRAQYDHLVKLLADQRALLPTPPILISSAEADAIGLRK